ncbi:MAG: hypothetical protein KF752_04585 [Pirellulaceae bacterium]|nr:hypothetical protein [Pirellulaceae bacterium]
MKILFLHGWQSVVGGLKPSYLREQGHEVINPALNDDDFALAVQTAQNALDTHVPQVVVGSSRGGAVAMNINSGPIPLVLLCPAWKHWGSADRIKPQSIVIHSPGDETIPFADSHELIVRSALPPETLLAVGTDHRLADAHSLAAMLRACEQLVWQTGKV